jgi:uncharacterized LabA/DUF88 family protein
MEERERKTGGDEEKGKRAALFIDGANLFFTQRHLGWPIDFSRLISFFSSRYASLKAYYYVPASDPVPEESASFTRLLTSLGFRVTSKPVKKIHNRETGEVIMKGNLDVELAVDAMSNADEFDVFILFSGDSDFLPLLRALKGMHKDVIVYSTQGLSARELLAEPGVRFADLAVMKEQLLLQRAGDGTSASDAIDVGRDYPVRLPALGEKFTGSVLKVAPYGIFLSNPYHAKCLLPLSFLGITKHISDLVSIVRMSDLFDVTVFHVNTTHVTAEITVKLADKAMSEELASRIKE